MRVRVVEDTKALAYLFCSELERAGFDVELTSADFHSLLSPECWEGIDGAVVDLFLPEVKGVDVLRYLHDHHPEIKRVAMTAALSMADEAIGLAGTVLVKPFPTADLVEALR